MTQYYVSNAATNGFVVGNDANAGTAKGTAWLTVEKALATVAAGDTVNINAGTYVESSSGNGYLNLRGVFASTVTFQTDSGARDVTIKGNNTNGYTMLQQGAVARITFRHLTWDSPGSAGVHTARLIDYDITSLTFYNCAFLARVAAATQTFAFRALSSTSNAFTWSGILFDGCSFTGNTSDTTLASYAIQMSARPAFESATITAQEAKDIQFLNCTVVNTLCAASFFGLNGPNPTMSGASDAAALTIRGGSWRTTGGTGSVTLEVGYDSTPGTLLLQRNAGLITAVVEDAFIEQLGGSHAMLIGAGSVNTVFQRNLVKGTVNYAMVCKENNGSVIRRNLFYSSSGSSANNAALYFKGCQGAKAYANTLIADYNGANTNAGLMYGTGDTGNTVKGVRCFDNWVVAGGNSWACRVVALDGTYVTTQDENVYDLNGSATWGNVLGTSCAALSNAQTAWGATGTGYEDANSVNVASAQIVTYARATTTSEIYAVVTDSSGRAWDGQRFDYPSSNTWSLFAHRVGEKTYGSGTYALCFPLGIVKPGDYTVKFYAVAGYTPTSTDTVAQTGTVTVAGGGGGGSSGRTLFFIR